MAAGGVRGAVRRAAVGLDLDDAAGGDGPRASVDQRLAEQRARHAQRGLEIERAGQGPLAGNDRGDERRCAVAAHEAFSFFTSSVSSGTALKRSATRP